MTTTPANQTSRKGASAALPSGTGSLHRESATGIDLPVLFRVPKVATSFPLLSEHAPEVSLSPVLPPPQPTVEWLRNESPATVVPSGVDTRLETVSPAITPAERNPPAAVVPETSQSNTIPTTSAAAESAPTAPQPVARLKVKDAKPSGSWFDNQGKLITVCFLLALTATIYFARSKRQEAEPMAADTEFLEIEMPTAEQPAMPTEDAAPEWRKTDELQAPKRRPSRDLEVARRQAVEAAESAPRADLLPPMDLSAPPLVQGPPSDPNAPPANPITPRDPATTVATPDSSPYAEIRTAELPANRPTGRSTWGASELPAPETSMGAPPAGYPALPTAAPSAGQTYPATNAAPYRYYMPPSGNPAGPSTTLPQGSEPNYERSGSGLY